jgi:hypothetical protein
MRAFAGVEVYDDALVAHSGNSGKIANVRVGLVPDVLHMNVRVDAIHSGISINVSDVTP